MKPLFQKASLKTFVYLFVLLFAGFVSSAQTKMKINVNSPASTIDKHMFGHFTEQLSRCIYDGFGNTFEQPEKVKLALFTDFEKKGNTLWITLPPMSVVSIQFVK